MCSHWYILYVGSPYLRSSDQKLGGVLAVLVDSCSQSSSQGEAEQQFKMAVVIQKVLTYKSLRFYSVVLLAIIWRYLCWFRSGSVVGSHDGQYVPCLHVYGRYISEGTSYCKVVKFYECTLKWSWPWPYCYLLLFRLQALVSRLPEGKCCGRSFVVQSKLFVQSWSSFFVW